MERDFAKIILKIPLEDVNCHIKMGRKIVDFYPQSYDKMFQGKFVEFHPYDFEGRGYEEYYKKRRKVLDNGGFKDKELIVIKNLNELK